VPASDAEARCEFIDASVVEQTGLDEIGRGVSDAGAGIDARVSGREFGTAPQTRAMTGRFGRRGAWKELAVFTVRRAGRAHGPAIDPG
jgi:hypothetical protein